jgi:type III pantothenate kinase
MTMRLLIDIGNTNTEFGLFKNHEKIESWRITSKLYSTEDEIAVIVRNFFRFVSVDFKDIDQIGISSVVPQNDYIFSKFSQKYFNQDAFFVNEKSNLPIEIKYESPSNVGADRISASVAAFLRFKAAVIILDFGTATTFDVVNSKGHYVGGVITLGIQGIINALHTNAAKLPKVNFEIPQNYIGHSTEKSIQSGLINGSIHMIQGIISGIKKELNEDCHVIATGGFSTILSGHIKEIEEIDQDLILKGIISILEQN